MDSIIAHVTLLAYAFIFFKIMRHESYCISNAEYGMGNKVSVYGDVYSYGILLLEMFTKKGPTDDMFRGAVDLHSFVKEALPHRVIEITDPILFQERGGERNFRRNKIPEYLISILGIGVACSTNQPGERMNIKEVVARLHMIKKKLVADDDVFV